MSMKNRVLLKRSGRDQFGNKGNTESVRYESSEEQKAIDTKQKEEHKKLNDLFVKKYRDDWQKLFRGLNKKEVWSKIAPYGKPSLNTFYTYAREHESFSEFLTYWLVANKRKAMILMNVTEDVIKAELSKYKDCGRYCVTYGTGRMFGTNDI